MAVILQSGKVRDEPVHRPKEQVKKQDEQLNKEGQDETRAKRLNSGNNVTNDNIPMKC